MAGPWEQYQQQQPAAPVEGPWTQYAQQPPQAGTGTTETQRDDGTLVIGMSHSDQKAPPAAPVKEPEAPGFFDKGWTDPNEWARQAGLTARAAVSGVTALPGMIVDLPVRAANAFGADMQLPSQAQQALMTRFGLPEPQNAQERVVQDVAGALSGTGASMGAGKAMASLGQGAVKGVGEMLSSGARMQSLAASTGATASGIAREEGASPLVQGLLGIGAGAAPGLLAFGVPAAVRGLLRGGESGRQNMLQNIDLFKQVGTTPTIGQASQNRLAQGMESALSRAPGGAGIMNAKAVGQTGQISQTIDDLVGRLTPRAGPVEAGESILRGLDTFKQGFATQRERLYNKLDRYLPAQAPITVGQTREMLAALNSDIKGAPSLSKMFQNGRIQGIEKALMADLDATPNVMGSLGGERSAASMTLPYDSIKKLRTAVGKEIDNFGLTSDVPRDKWRALYAALSEDLGGAARNAGPEATEAWRQANVYNKTQTARLEALDSIAGKDSPERVFQAALAGSKEGDTIVRRVVGAIPVENRKDLAGAVIKRMGRATAGNQNDAGDVFSTNTFLTNWNNLSPSARNTLFGRIGDASILDEMARLAGVASNIKDGSKVFANPSGTSGASALNALLVGGASALASGHLGTAAGLASVPMISNVGARMMTSPKALDFLSRPTSTPYELAPGLLNGIMGQ